MMEQNAPSDSSPPKSSRTGGGGLWMAMAALAHVALVSATFEMLRSGSPVRWWVLGIVLAYLAGLLAACRFVPVVWKRVTTTALATSGGGLLLGLLAVTAWLPGGTENGVRLLGQSTATLLAAVSAVAVAVAGFSLLKLRALPPWSRYLLSTLAIYGVFSFAIGIARATPYASLFHGGSSWTRLPQWLQGAVVGGLVILPLGLVGVVVQQGLRSFRRVGSGGWALQQIVALALSLAITLSGVAVPGNVTSQARDGRAAAGPITEPPAVVPGAVVPINTRLELPLPPPPDPTPQELQARVEAVTSGIPRERYDTNALARSLGPGVEPAFGFVRDRIRYEAYSGVLRGADGTLAAKAGNAFDRSMLLAAILAVHGVRTRFVRCELPRPQANVLFGRIFGDPRPAMDFADTKGQPTGQTIRFWERLTARARRDYTVIRAALGNAMPLGTEPSRERALRDIQQHVWVQAEADGRWLDLDTSFAAAKPGDTYCTARQTVEELPSDWYQRITIRVTEERLEDGALTTNLVLDGTYPAVELVDQQVFLLHVPDTSGRGGTGLSIGGVVQGADRWAPALSIGEDLDIGRPVSFADGEQSSGMFDALGGGSSSVLVAEWLELEVTRPDGRRDVTRRALVDRATSAWRASSPHQPNGLRTLERDQQGVVAPRALKNIWFSAGPHNLRAYADVIAGLALAGAEEPDREPPLDVQLLPLASSNFSTLVWADDVIIPDLNGPAEVRLYSDSPRIVIVNIVPDAQGGATVEYDLARDPLCGLARGAAADARVTASKIWFGTLEGALEHEALASDVAMTGGDPSAVVSTSSLLTSDGVVVIAPSDVDRLPLLTSDAEKAARLRAGLVRGNLLVVPRGALAKRTSGWWEIAPDGDTRAVLDDDWVNANGNMSKVTRSSGLPATNSAGGTKQMPTKGKTFDLSKPSPSNQPTWSKNFGKSRPRPPKEVKKRSGLEYGLIVALVAMTVYLGVKIYGTVTRKTTAQLDLVDAASGAGRGPK